MHDAAALSHKKSRYLTLESAAKGMGLKIALFGADPHPMQLPLEAVPQEHSSVFANVCDVSLILACKQPLLHALFECAITADQEAAGNAHGHTDGFH